MMRYAVVIEKADGHRGPQPTNIAEYVETSGKRGETRKLPQFLC
jgi:hypothetical protein